MCPCCSLRFRSKTTDQTSIVYATGLTEEDMDKPQVRTSATGEQYPESANSITRSVSHRSGGKVCSIASLLPATSLTSTHLGNACNYHLVFPRLFAGYWPY